MMYILYLFSSKVEFLLYDLCTYMNDILLTFSAYFIRLLFEENPSHKFVSQNHFLPFMMTFLVSQVLYNMCSYNITWNKYPFSTYISYYSPHENVHHSLTITISPQWSGTLIGTIRPETRPHDLRSEAHKKTLETVFL